MAAKVECFGCHGIKVGLCFVQTIVRIQWFTRDFIEFACVETNKVVGSNSSVILTGKSSAIARARLGEANAVDNEHAVIRAENREIFGQFAMNLYLTLNDSIENDHRYKLSFYPYFFF